MLETLKPDIWLAAHTETYDFEEKLARSKKAGLSAWIDPQGYRLWLVGQRDDFEETVNREMGIAPRKKTGAK